MLPPMNALTRNVQISLEESPVSLRQLSRRCKISHVQLARIVAGERNATEAVAVAIADALEEVAKEAAKASVRVRRSLTAHL